MVVLIGLSWPLAPGNPRIQETTDNTSGKSWMDNRQTRSDLYHPKNRYARYLNCFIRLVPRLDDSVPPPGKSWFSSRESVTKHGEANGYGTQRSQRKSSS
jgi:hypothetical protein